MISPGWNFCILAIFLLCLSGGFFREISQLGRHYCFGFLNCFWFFFFICGSFFLSFFLPHDFLLFRSFYYICIHSFFSPLCTYPPYPITSRHIPPHLPTYQSHPLLSHPFGSGQKSGGNGEFLNCDFGLDWATGGGKKGERERGEEGRGVWGGEGEVMDMYISCPYHPTQLTTSCHHFLPLLVFNQIHHSPFLSNFSLIHSLFFLPPPHSISAPPTTHSAFFFLFRPPTNGSHFPIPQRTQRPPHSDIQIRA